MYINQIVFVVCNKQVSVLFESQNIVTNLTVNNVNITTSFCFVLYFYMYVKVS